jgi:hypothetical protein
MFFRNNKKTKKEQPDKNGDDIKKAAGFVVDLKKELNKDSPKKGSGGNRSDSSNIKTKKKEVSKKNALNKTSVTLSSFISFLILRRHSNNPSIGFIHSSNKKKGREKEELKKRVNELTVFNIFKIGYRICYTVGWFTVFFFRFFAILGYRLSKGLLRASFFAKKKTFYKCKYGARGVILIFKKIRHKFSDFVEFNMERVRTLLFDLVSSSSLQINRSISFTKKIFVSAYSGTRNGYDHIVEQIAEYRNRFSDFVEFNAKKIQALFSKLISGSSFQISRLTSFTKRTFISVYSGLRGTYDHIVERITLLFRKYIFSKVISSRERIKKTRQKNKEKKMEERIWEKNKILEEIKYHKNGTIKTITAFSFLAILMILPFKAITYYESLNINDLKKEVLLSTREAGKNLEKASASMSALNMEEAYANFGEANINFSQAENKISKINGVILDLAKFLPDQEARMASMGKDLLKAGNLASEMGAELTLAFEGVTEAEKDEVIKAINDFDEHGNKAVNKLEELNRVLGRIDTELLPEQYRDKADLLKRETDNLEKLLTEFVGITEELNIFLGAKRDKNYLLIFQNNTELRATGGFIGSYALVGIGNGKIKNIEVPAGGSYDVRAGMTEFYESPEPLHLISPLWHFWDANWWPDWPTSARNLMKFYSDSGGPTTDGVISFTPTVLERILEVTGPIDMEEDYGVTFTSDNCEEELRSIIEKEAGHTDKSKKDPEEKDTTKPKKIIGDLMNEMNRKIVADFNRKKLIELIGAVSSSLEEKQMLFYFTDEELQEEVEKRGWGGKLKNTDRDYLSVINSNIAGRKSDKKITQRIHHKARIKADGSIVNEVRIKRRHTGSKNTPYYGERNVNWMRVYIPEGSELIDAEGFNDRPDEVYFDSPDKEWEEHPLVNKQRDSMRTTQDGRVKVYNTEIYGDADKTVIAGWSMLDPGETKTITLKYELPFEFVKKENKKENFSDIAQKIITPEQKELYPYSLYIQKQPGMRPDDSRIESEIIFPDDYSMMWKYPEDREDGKTYYENSLNSDRYWAVLLEKLKKNE